MSSGGLITRLRKKYQALRVVETLLFAVGGACVVWSLCTLLAMNFTFTAAVTATVAAIVTAIRITQLRITSLTDERVSYFLNGKFSILQDSSELLIRPHGELSVIEKIQVNRLDRAINSLSKVVLPNKLTPALITFIVGAAAVVLTGFIEPTSPLASNNQSPNDGSAALTKPAPPILSRQSLTVQPPAYTGQKATSSERLSTTAPQGSVLAWAFEFSTQPTSVALAFMNGDSVMATIEQGKFNARSTAHESFIYQVRWHSPMGVHSSDYFEVIVKPDAAPTVAVTSLNQFTRLGWGEKTFIDVPVHLRDDYGLTKGHIIATVAKGSGESVKFREETLTFDNPASITGREVRAHRRINFGALGMEPGDEIYFYAEAWDNKTPQHQRTRTETFFVSLEDTARHAIIADASLGVDLMPDYFRSQRQIIIDTEKLLKDKPTISTKQFKSTSNELGYDQKVLRLKYGQFLGEEFETAIGEPAHESGDHDDDEEEKDPTKKFGHQHDTENEHSLVPEKKDEPGHKHEENENDPMAAFKHNHDNMEEATFFTQSVRTKLKAALTLMWDSELQLRLFEPKASLPIQYKILNLLKEISQDSRIYVHRMGFDPPPLKEEKRLTGDLSEIRGPRADGIPVSEKANPAIRKALVSLNTAIETKVTSADQQLKSDLDAAAREIAAVSISMPGNYLGELSMIRGILDDQLAASELLAALVSIRSVCWRILPEENPGPGKLGNTHHMLDLKLLDQLKKQANE